MQLNDNELSLVRNTEHRTNLYISIYDPNIIFACQVDDASISKGARAIAYDSISQGSGTFIDADMLMLIGSSAGDDDIGSIRLKGITGSYLYVAENSDIQWADDLHLTVLDYVAPNPIFPRIVQDPNNVEEVIFYKDWDIEYSDQNSVLGTFVCAGPHRAGFLTTGSFYVDFSASGSYNVKGDGLTYDWNFGADAIPTGSTARDPGLVSWSTVGHKSVRLIVSNNSGGEDISYRYVSIYDRPTKGNTLPPLKWELLSFAENRSEGGTTARIRVHQILSNLRKHSLVVLWTEDWFGDDEISLGGNYPGASDIFFNGFILDGSIHYDYEKSYTEFEVTSLTNIMKEIENFPISIEDNASPSTWYEVLNMNPPKAIYHFLRWHSTFLKLVDLHYLDTTVPVQYFDSSREGMFDSLNTFCKTGMIGSVVSDRQGTIWIEKAPEGQTNARTHYQIPMYLQKHDWIGQPDITERLKNQISYVELGGIAFTGPTGTSLAYIGAAPGISPANVGNVESNQGLILTSQQELNQLAGNVYAYRNSKYPNASFQLKGNYRNLDIAPLENVPITIDTQDTVRGIQLTAEPFHIQSIEWRYLADEGYLYLSNIALAQLTNGEIGDTINIPVIPPTQIIIPPIPPISIPPLPPIELPELYVTGTSLGPEVVLIHDRNAGLLVTTNFDEDYPIWLPFNNGMPSGTYTKIGSVHMTPGGQLYVPTLEDSDLSLPINKGEMGGTSLWYAPFFGSSFGQVITNEIVQAYVGTAGTKHIIGSIGVDPLEQNKIAMVLFRDDDYALFIHGSPDDGFNVRGNWADMRPFVGAQWTAGCYPMSFGDGQWVMPVLAADLFSRSYLAVFSADGNARDYFTRLNIVGGTSDFSDTRPVLAERVGESGRLYYAQFSDGNFFKQSLDNGATYPELVSTPGDLPSQYWKALVADESGQYIMRNFAGPIVKRSSDYGETWATITGTFATGTFDYAEATKVFENALSPLIWIAAQTHVDYTNDFGDTWTRKDGNLLTIVPTPNIMQVIIVQ